MYRFTRKHRLYIIFLAFYLTFFFLISRLFVIQLARSSYFSQIAAGQHNVTMELRPTRGNIYDRNMHPMALTLDMESVFANPREMTNKEEVAETLAPILEADEDYLLERLSRVKSFVWLARRVSRQASSSTRELGLESVGLLREPKRFYPNGKLSSHLIGFVGVDNCGLQGIELVYDKYLKGARGFKFAERDAKSRKLASFEEKLIPPVDGYDLVLTIDEVIQHIVETELDRAWDQYNPKAATAIVMDPKNGQILALSNRPTFDPNAFQDATQDAMRNRAIADIFEPGSSFKFVTASAVLEEGLVDVEEEFFCENGTYRMYGRTLHDYKPYGWLSFKGVMENSSNIGIAKVAQKLGRDNLYKYVRAYGIGTPTGIDLEGEVSGFIRPPNLWSGLSISSIPMGQEVAVTPIQLLCAISVVANDGLLVRPYCVRRIQDKDGQVIKHFEPQVLRRVLSPESARMLREILVGVVENGTGRQARIEGFSVAGKTGTAQKVEPDGKYSHSRFIASFIGFVPAQEPLISLVVIIDEPRPYYYGGVVAAPVFKRIASQAVRYLQSRSLQVARGL